MEKENNNILIEIVILRNIAILGVVLYHSFSVFYPQISGKNYLYDICFNNIFMAISLNMAMLPLFTFISGYLFSHSNFTRNRSVKYKVKSKFKRIVIPFFVFGLLFSIFFNKNMDIMTIAKYIIRGADHLWYLPMLFMCFAFMAFIEYNTKLIFIPISLYLIYFLFDLETNSVIDNFFAFQRFLYFFPWFIIGYITYKYRQLILKRIAKKEWILFLCYCCIVTYEILTNNIDIGISFNLFKYINQLLFIYILYTFLSRKIFNLNIHIQNTLSLIDKCSFGIYIFHLPIIYFLKRALLFIINPDQLMIGYIIIIYVISFLSSLYITFYIRKTNYGLKLL